MAAADAWWYRPPAQGGGLMPLVPVEPLSDLSDSVLSSLREALIRGSYDEEALSMAERVAPGQFDAVRLPLVRWTLEQRGDARSQLALLFAYQCEVSEATVRSLLGVGVVEALLGAGVLQRGEGGLRAGFRLLPLDGNHI